MSGSSAEIRRIRQFYEEMPIGEDFPILLEDVYTQDDAPIVQLHRHNAVEIGLCLSGSGIFNIQNTYVPFSEGDVVLLSRNTFHFAQSQVGTVSTWQYAFLDVDALMMKYLPSTVDTNLMGIFHRKFGHIYTEVEFAVVNGLVKRTILEMRHQEDYYELKAISHLLELLILLNRNSSRLVPRFFASEEHPADSIEKLSPAISMIQRHYAEEIHIGHLTEVCHMSERSFMRHFRKAYGIPPYDYLLELRLTMVCKDLKTTDRPIGFIAGANGFGSLSSLNRQFKKRFGTTPSAWRKQSPSLPPSG